MALLDKIDDLRLAASPPGENCGARRMVVRALSSLSRVSVLQRVPGERLSGVGQALVPSEK